MSPSQGGEPGGEVALAAGLAALEGELERRFRTARTRVALGAREVELLHPANYDDLITEEDFVRDERLPYWADLWPSAIALARWLAAGEGAAARLRPGARALELGCGMGLVSTVLALGGARVLATDYYDDALLFARLNGGRNAGAAIETRNVDWRDFPTDLGRFDLVVASDVLYERPYAALLAHALRLTLDGGGVGLIADPGRIAVESFVDECRARGLRVEVAERLPYESGTIRQTITVYELTRAR
ncbi:MAG: class I SAM-dependent methyltransferase [Gemmatimonadaceae bacterium]